jgi:perosamine synthetase
MIRLAKPYITETTIEKVAEVLRSGNLVQGQYVREFEAALEKYLGVEHAIVVSSGTAALHLSLLATGIGPGDEVIVPAFTFPATVNVVEIVGAIPVLVDITLEDYCIDVTKIEEVITPKTKAIIPVHEFGQSADIAPILNVARKYKLKIIEDAACALGTEYNNKKAGTFGDLGCFSFHPRKAITTGEGGAIVTESHELAEKIRSLRNHGISSTNGKIDFEYAGLNYRITDFQAILGSSQLSDMDYLISQRMETAKIYDDSLRGIDWIDTPERIDGRKHVYQTYHVMVDEGIDRDKLIESLKTNGVETNIGAYALHMIGYYQNKYDYTDVSYIQTKNSYLHGLALPLGQHISQKNGKLISNTLIKTVAKYYG